MQNQRDNLDLRVYIGLRMFVITCDGDRCTDAQSSQHWDSTDCSGSYCEYCQSSCDSSVTTAFLGLFTILPQLSTNIQRSTGMK